MNNFISATEVQRQTTKVLRSKKPFQVVLLNNEATGIVINKEMTEMLLESGALEELRQEMFEYRDSETRKLVEDFRAGKRKGAIEFKKFRGKYDL